MAAPVHERILRRAALRVTLPRLAVLAAVDARPPTPSRSSTRHAGTCVCRSCGAIAAVDCAVDCAVGVTPCLTASDHRGFSIDEAEIIYWGVCPDRVRAPAPG
ncbi:hypothetical protein [Plantactinospora sonchi]|uniref:Transcriptional regulator n=1 Tax=Plantactinospora sonchi TaxID=1544735 RepID=A0ABU7RYT5_9ACTN